jgi:hypothetical protein
MLSLVVTVGWFLLSFVVASAASQRGRSGFGWFLFSLVTTPVVAALFLLLFPPSGDPAAGALLANDRATQKQIKEGQRREPQFQSSRDLAGEASSIDQYAVQVRIHGENAPDSQPNRGILVGTLVAIAVVVALIIGVLKIREATGPAFAVASLPCPDLLNAYGTASFDSLSDPVIQHIRETDDSFGSTINIVDYVLTQCRLNERYNLGEAVADLFVRKQQKRLPQIPIGGATQEPLVQATWAAFDRWIHHQGPPPDFGAKDAALAQREALRNNGQPRTSPGNSSSGRPKLLAVEMTVSATPTNPPVITGVTNLPDGTRLSAWMVGDPPACVPNCGFFLPDATVNNKGFTIELKSRYGKLISGTYTLDILMYAIHQPQSVKSLLGPLGENLRGPYVVTSEGGGKYAPAIFPSNPNPSEGEQYMGRLIHYRPRIFVASDSASDAKVRAQAIADDRKQALEKDCPFIEAVKAGGLTGREIPRAELKASIEACVADRESKLQSALSPAPK